MNDLARRAAQQDSAACREIIDELKPTLASLIAVILGSTIQEAGDLAQDIFLKIFLDPAKLANAKKPDVYLKKMAYHQVIDYSRKMKRRLHVDPGELDLLVDREGADGMLLEKERREARIRAEAYLTPRERQIYDLHFHQGLSQKQIVGKTGLSPANVEKHLNKARTKMKALLAPWRNFLLLLVFFFFM